MSYLGLVVAIIFGAVVGLVIGMALLRRARTRWAAHAEPHIPDVPADRGQTAPMAHAHGDGRVAIPRRW